ncbi:lysophospholipid acyltransferase family protein [Enterovirga sp. CN4-39]|uniref:lysophospholipid acyltransferase family protein n=1 Tax=Enterovirga sp. CN4-39 TaxID=3400910 RepID=UPI003BFB39C5
MRGLPTDVCSSLGARLAPRLGKVANPVSHQRATELLKRLEPNQADATVERLWANVGRTFAEFAVSHRMLKAGRVAIDGEEHLTAALSSGRPIIALFPHLGNWELAEMQFGFRAPGRVAVIVAPPASGARAVIAERVRSKVPADLLVKSRTVWRHGLAKLREPGGIFMVAADESASGRVWGPSLGRPLRTDGNLGKAVRLALTTGATVLPFHSERIEGAHLISRYMEPIELRGDARDQAAVSEGVRLLDQIIEVPVRRLLDQWYMALAFRG